jgi:hypothetical protein
MLSLLASCIVIWIDGSYSIFDGQPIRPRRIHASEWLIQLLRLFNSEVMSYLANECEGEGSECLHSLSFHAGFGWQQVPESWVHYSFGQSLQPAGTNEGSYSWPPKIQETEPLSHHISKMQARQLSQCKDSTSCEVSASMTDSWNSLSPYLRFLRSFAA